MMPLPTRALCECVPSGISMVASSFGFFGSLTSTTEVPCGLRIWPTYAMLFSTTTCPPPGQSNNPACLIPFAFAIECFSTKIFLSLLDPHAGLLDDARPLVVFAFDIGGECLRRIRNRIRAECEQPFVHLGQIEY